jgi:hypothetical protein
MAGATGATSTGPWTLADLVPGGPAITWDHLTKSYAYAAKGDYERAIGTMMNAGLDKEGSVFMNSLQGGFCSNCTILAIKTDLVYEDGTRMDISNGVYLHHAVSTNMGWRQMTNWLSPCPAMNPIMKSSFVPARYQVPGTMFGNTAVDEFQQWFGSPKEYGAQGGMFLSADDHILLQAEMINYTPQEKKLYIKFDYEYMEGRLGKETTFTVLSTLGKCLLWNPTRNLP